MKIEELYTMYKYKDMKYSKYRKLSGITLYLYGILYILWHTYTFNSFKNKRAYIEELTIKSKKTELRGKVGRFICPTYYMKVGKSHE